MIKKELVWVCDACCKEEKPTEYSENWTPKGSLTLKAESRGYLWTCNKEWNDQNKHFCNISCLHKYTLDESTRIALEEKKEQRGKIKDYASDVIEQSLHDNPIYYANPFNNIVTKIQ